MRSKGLRLTYKWVSDVPNPKTGKRENTKVSQSHEMMDVSEDGINKRQ